MNQKKSGLRIYAPSPALFCFATSSLSAQSASGAAAMPAKAAEPAKSATIRIKAGVTEPHKDEAGVTWLADQGFADGETTDRPGIEVKNTKTPSLYLSERYSMTK